MALLEWHYVLTAIVVFCFWLFSTVKKFHKQINKKNSRIPDVKILQKIIPPSCHNGWKVKAVCNALPVWSYSTSFTFAPRNMVATRTVLRAKSSRILEELKNIKVFSMIFPDFPTFKVEGKNNHSGDLLYLSNMFSSLSLTNILLSGQQTVLTFERCWSCETNMSWLYVTPTVQLLTSRYGYWICFLLVDMEYDNSSILHILASYPADVSSHEINRIITSCQVLIKEHIDSIQQERMKPLLDSSDNDSLKVKVNKRSTNSSTQPASPSLASTTVNQKPPLSTMEAYGHVEEPAVIKHYGSDRHLNSSHHHSNSDLSETKPKQTESSQKTTNTMIPDKEPATSEQTEPIYATVNKVKKVIKNEKLEPYLDLIDEGYKLLLSIYEADENTGGWELFNRKNDVVVHKKVGTEEFPNDIYKGKTSIKVPLGYLLNYLLDMQYKSEYDDVFESGSTVEELGDGITKVICLVYKNIWPVTGRDFCSISAPRHVKDNLYGIMIKAVTHPNCPEKKSKVRGECIIGGFILEHVSVDTVNITFVVCANFNGYIPSKLVNKVSSDQPLSVGIIRKKVEHRYKIKDPDTDGGKVLDTINALSSIFPKEEGIITETNRNTNTKETMNTELCDKTQDSAVGDETRSVTMVTEEVISIEMERKLETSDEDVNVGDRSAIGTPFQIKREESQDGNESCSPTIDNEAILCSGFDLKENHYTYSDELLHFPHKTKNDISDDDSESIGDLSQTTEDGMYQSQLSIDEPVEYPRDAASGQIDFVTLGNQCAATLEDEFLIARKVDTSVKHDPTKQEKDVWKYQGTSKDVVIMRKVSSKHKFYSFLGRGIINVLPVTVWGMIKTPSTRFVYDGMLKKITSVKELSETSKILHMRHETHACFVKQARDFSFMTVEQMKEQRYLLCGTSVDVPECPLSSDCVRGTIFSSGWVIEPIVQNGKSCSLVTYISQVDFGGRLPTRLVNFIAKRQPLAVAYLRNYLEEAER